MLSDLAIKNFAIIDDLHIAFETGFSVLTGETGAGKSIILQAVDLLLGARSSSDLVRFGCESAELEAFFEIDERSHAAAVLKDQGMSHSEGLMIRRVITAAGKSRIFINSRLSTLGLLKEVTRNLAGISSQHAHQGLLKEENHLDILDVFANTVDIKNEVKTLYNQITPLRQQIRKLKETLEKQMEERDFLKFQIDEIDEAAIEPGEDEALEKKKHQLLNASRTFETVNRGIHEIYDRDGSVIENVSLLRDNLEKAGDSQDGLETAIQQLSSVLYDLQDVVGVLRDVSEDVDLDPISLEQTEERMNLVSRLKRKYGGSLESLFSEYDTMQKKLVSTDEIQQQIEMYETEVQVYTRQIREKALHLSKQRVAAVKKMASLVRQELHALEMEKVQFEVDIDHRPAGTGEDIVTEDQQKIGPDGMDRIRFLISPNPGEPLKPLVKIASGGELSRIVLALKVVLSKNNTLETLIFDEVDAGIGGAVSEKVGLKLKQLSQNHQVICITHLAQIAKYAGHQFRILKEEISERTCTRIIPLGSRKERVAEIARMIGGKNLTDATQIHASELLDQGAS